MEKYKLLFIEKVPSYLCHGHQIYPNGVKEMQLTQTYIVENEFLLTLINKFTELKRSF